MKINYFILAIFLLYSLPTKSNDELKRGLFFRSFEVDKDKRTSLDLTPNQSLIFKKGFSMEFDVKLRLAEQTFGYIFRIICNDTLNVDLLADITSNVANFSLVVKNRTAIQFKNSELLHNVEDTWIKVFFVFDPANRQISLSLNGIKKEVSAPVERMNRFSIYFGGNTHRDFSTTDISPMTVKDIRFFDEKQKLVRHWELSKHSSDCVYDECISGKAAVQNPVWEIDRHAKWNKKETMVCAGQNYHIAFNRNDGRIYFAGDRTVFSYDVHLHKMDTVEVISGASFIYGRSNQLVYDDNRCVLLSYSLDGKCQTTFDFSAKSWNNHENLMYEQRHSHHSRLFIPEDSMLVTFGGYGHHRYNSLFYKYHVSKNIWETIHLSNSIQPRYLGSMGRLNDRQLLYFGGFGSETGIQEEFPHNYYDLYSIDVDEQSVKKIWELSNPDEHFTNSNSLVIDKHNGKFYALAYPNKRYASVIKLHEYSLDKPDYHIVGDSIPYYFNDIESYCDLFQTAGNSELYAVTSYVRGNSSEINIYSIAFPPLCLEEITQYPPSRTNIWTLLLLLTIVLAGIVIIFLYRKWKMKRKAVTVSGNSTVHDFEEDLIVYDRLFEKIKPSSINLLGAFQIVNSNRDEITKNFTPTTTQLFLILLMSTIKNGKGITSHELRRILWFDKDDDSARNNRNVYVNKLRAFLKSFPEIKLMNQKGYWTIQYEKTVFCDYKRALVIINKLQADEQFNKKLITELVDIALKGALLPYVQQTEWLEPYQSDYADQLIECLIKYSKRDELKTDLLLLLKLADTILLYDNTDEDAIKLKCYALFRSGKKNQALQVFNKFTADYKNLLGADHHLVFEELVR